MSAKSKLNEARKRFHSREIKKTGHNSFSNYDYFELADFLIPALDIFNELKLSGIVSFGVDLATLEITDLEDEASMIAIHSPMSTASLKACHEVQNLGAVQTYIRRYLWATALEIVEHDALDSSPGAVPKEAPNKRNKLPLQGRIDEIKNGIRNGDSSGAAEYLSTLPRAELDAIWGGLTGPEQDELNAAWPKD